MATSISFPSSPTLNDTYVYGTATYVWTGGRWRLASGSNSLDSLSDTILTGATAGDSIIFSGGTWIPSAGGGGGAATIVDDVLPDVIVGGTWYQPSTGNLAVGIDDSWVLVSKAGKDGIDGLYAVASVGSGTTVIELTNLGCYYYDMSSANTATTYTTTGTVIGAVACVLINATSEPTVTGATKIAGSDFQASTDMHMWLQYFGATVQYWFIEL